MRLVVITQRVDPDDPALGATVHKLRALAERVDELVVLALDARPAGLPANVRVKVFGASSQAARGARLIAALAPELRDRPVAVLAHMAPIYAILAAPLVRPLRVPLLLWFTHWRASPTLRLAERMSTRVLTVGPGSFPIPSGKLVTTGHGVEVPAQPFADHADDGRLHILALGRTSPAKGLETLLDAVALLPDLPVFAELRGPSLTLAERAHRDVLAARAAEPGFRGRASVEGPLPAREVPDLYARSDLLVSNMRAGALDKVVFEAAAGGLPVLVASEGFADLVQGLDIDLHFSQDDAASLADRIRALHAAGPRVRRRIGLELRRRVQEEHSAGQWADRVLEAAR